jgi:LacI family transcriptional regulator
MAIPAVGVIVPRMNDHYIISVLQGIGQALDRWGYDVMITHSHGSSEQEAAITRLLINEDVRGIIACPSGEAQDLRHFSAFTRRGVPVVFFDYMGKLEETTSVVIDSRGCGFTAAEHLIGQGCRRIAVVTSDLRRYSNAQRFEGFLRGLRSYDVPFSDELLIVGEMDEAGGTNAAARLLCMDPMPDGVFITSDLAAAVCMHALQEAGVRVPEDLAIVGFNNEPPARLITPSLTTIEYPGWKVGRVAAERLLERASGSVTGAAPRTVVVPASLIVRQSSLRTNTFRPFTLPC